MVQPVGNERFSARTDEPAQVPAEEQNDRESPPAPRPLVNPAILSQAQETGEPARATTGPVQEIEAGETEEPPRPFADPTRLREVQQGEDGESEEIRLGLQGEEESTDIAARLVPLSGVESVETVALDGRPESVRVGDLVSEDQRLTGDPLDVPNYAVDPNELSIQNFNERLSRTVEVLQFLSEQPNVSRARGVSIVV
ncbi:hypothetical protein [Nisaea sp.]|uniref:hypothetical protein n=1 Tax=Nisaea sp. TaxID=2024842 RepID=UPI003B5181B9